MDHHEDESLLDKVKNALGMGDDDRHTPDAEADSGRADGWAGVPEALHEDPDRAGAARYEGGAAVADLGGSDLDADGDPDLTREDAVATHHGGAYGADDTPMPTAEAFDRGTAVDDPELAERRGTEF